MERSVKTSGGLKLVSQYQPHPYQDTWMFGLKEISLPYLNYLLKHTNENNKGDKANIRTQQSIKLNTEQKKSNS